MVPLSNMTLMLKEETRFLSALLDTRAPSGMNAIYPKEAVEEEGSEIF